MTGHLRGLGPRDLLGTHQFLVLPKTGVKNGPRGMRLPAKGGAQGGEGSYLPTPAAPPMHSEEPRSWGGGQSWKGAPQPAPPLPHSPSPAAASTLQVK